jgi:hypothetical protein
LLFYQGCFRKNCCFFLSKLNICIKIAKIDINGIFGWEKEVMRDKFDIILLIVCFIVGLIIIYLVPNGKNGYWVIPLGIYWIIRSIRNKKQR